MSSLRKRYSASFKAKVALDAIKEVKTLTELSSFHKVHSNQISTWKKHILNEAPGLFSQSRQKSTREEEDLKARLYQEIGQLKVELDWLQKKTL